MDPHSSVPPYYLYKMKNALTVYERVLPTWYNVRILDLLKVEKGEKWCGQ